MNYFIAGLLIGLIVNLWSERRWYKLSEEINNDWSAFCKKQNADWVRFHANAMANQKAYYEEILSGVEGEKTEWKTK